MHMRLFHLLLPLYRVQRVPVLMIRVRHSECIDRYPTDPIDALVGHARRRCRNEVFVVYGTFSAIGRHETMRHIGYSVFELVGKKLTKGRFWLQQKKTTPSAIQRGVTYTCEWSSACIIWTLMYALNEAYQGCASTRYGGWSFDMGPAAVILFAGVSAGVHHVRLPSIQSILKN